MENLRKLMVVAFAVMAVAAINARTWRVNPNPRSMAPYKSLEELDENLNYLAGDTVLLESGDYGYKVRINRPNITLIGPGYYLGDNGEPEPTAAAVCSIIYMSEGSKVIGLWVKEKIYTNHNIVISRCHAHAIYDIYDNGIKENVEISECYVDANIQGIKNGIVRNNIIFGTPSYLYNVDFINNTIATSSSSHLLGRMYNCNIRNNIFINTKTGGNTSTGIPWIVSASLDFESLATNGNNVSYNVFSIPEQYANKTFTVGNKYCGATAEETFIMTGSLDGMYRLKEGSPAKGAASDGGDCGAFGGALPYQLSGIPYSVPRIVNAVVPGSPTNGEINVKLTISTKNE